MSADQATIFGLMIFLMAMFVWGRWRYDIVAIAGLLLSVLLGVVSPNDAFAGFSNAAVITVAAVLIISRGLDVSGAIDLLTSILLPKVKSMTLQLGSLTGIAAVLSAFMNNVGALALLMPATIEAARELKKSPSLFLMPLSFGSILGGLVTLIGTPPNIIIASFRGEALGEPYGMFDFTPVGIVIMVVGVIFLSLVGWRLVPKERAGKSAPDELFEIDAYVAELRVGENSKAIGISMVDVRDAAAEADVQIAGLIRRGKRNLRPAQGTILEEKDILLLEAGPDELDLFTHALDLEIVGEIEKTRALFSSDDVQLIEAVVTEDSRLVGRAMAELRLRSRYHINILGVSRSGRPIRNHLRHVVAKTGDILLFQADSETLSNSMQRLGLLPLAGRRLSMGQRDQAWIAAGLLASAVALSAAGLLSLTIALTTAALGMVLLNIVPPRDVYTAIDWPVIVLVAAMIPIGGALQTTGATELVATQILSWSGGLPAWVAVALLLLVTMTLSDVMNNVATAVVMAPVGLAVAAALGVNPDTFLMAVAVGASCAFLTPIGHKNNALILGPGGYKFGDYWRMGLPLEVLILLVAVPMILTVWPL